MSIRRRASGADGIEASEAELVGMTADLAERHQETLPKMRAAAVGWVETYGEVERSKSVSRRGFFATGGLVAAGGVLLAACGRSPEKARPIGTSGTGPGSSGSPGAGMDVQVGAMAASLENLAVFAYGSGLAAATAGRLGTVPPAVMSFARTAMSQHRDHADAWNTIVTGAGYRKVTVTDPVVTSMVQADFAKVKTVGDLANLALVLESMAAATYLDVLGVVQSKQAVSTAATVQPVEMQHAAILNFVLGNYPVPDAFAQTTGARPPGDLQVIKA